MKISIHTMYFLPDFGSAPILMDELARYLAGRGHEVEVVTTFPRVSARGPRGLAYSRRRASGFVVKRFWTPRTPHPFGRLMAWNIYTAGALLNILSPAKSDVLFLRTPPLQLGVPAFAAKRLRAARILLSVQDIHPDLAIESGILKNPAGIRFSRSLEKWVYGLADRIVVISDGFRRNLLAKGVPGPKMSVIPNWVDTEFLRPLDKDNPVSRKFGFDGKFVLMYSGTISISSDLALARVLEAARILAAERDIVFAIAGEGLRKDALRARAAALGLRNVIFLPFQPYGDLPNLLAAADVLLVPLDGEKSELSVPSKLYNFMAAGRPVLGLARPGSEVAAILGERQCGVPVSPGDAARIADAVRALKGSPEWRRALAANGRAYVVERFAKDKVLSAYDEIIRSMAS
ncbi:MAG: glycosyltransferase family 4 protein [Candidatus Aminicenantales bacterium]